MSYRYRREENIDMISILIFANIVIPSLNSFFAYQNSLSLTSYIFWLSVLSRCLHFWLSRLPNLSIWLFPYVWWSRCLYGLYGCLDSFTDNRTICPFVCFDYLCYRKLIWFLEPESVTLLRITQKMKIKTLCKSQCTGWFF